MSASPSVLARAQRVFAEFFRLEAAAGLVLIAAAVLALLAANSPWAHAYVLFRDTPLGNGAWGKSLHWWVNDALMAVFFLLVALEIKREALSGQLSSREQMLLPVLCAIGGVAVPALLFWGVNSGDPVAMRGWAIPTATDIAFALGVLSLLGNRVPAALKVFLTALAIIDDLGAVIIIALYSTSDLSLGYLGAALAILVVLTAMNRLGVTRLWLYLAIGSLLWFVVLRSGVHATLAGVALALTIPLRRAPGIAHDLEASPLHRLEHLLHGFVPYIVIPIFGFANAGVSFLGLGAEALFAPVTMGVAAGLSLGKLVGIFGAVVILVRLNMADLPAGASWMQMLGTTLLCGIGFTMSLFIGQLAFPASPLLVEEAKLGVLAGSLLSALLGYVVLRTAPQPVGQRAG